MIGRSRIDIKTQSARGRGVQSTITDVGMLIGPAPWGPMNVATECIDYPDFYDKFGGFLSSYKTGVAAKLFFESGGKRLVFTRICNIADHTASSTPASAVKATHTFATASGGTYSAQDTLKVDALYYGTRGNNITIKIQDASNGTASLFDLLVYENSILVEWHRNLSMLDSATRYVETVINTSTEKSKFIAVTDLALGGVPGLAADERPENVTATALTGGDDGLTSLATADYVGAVNHNTGLYAFNLVANGDMLFCVDDVTSTFQNAATLYAENEKKGKITFLTDTPASSDKAGVVAHAVALTASEYRTAVLWPQIKISNPSKSVYGQASQLLLPASPLWAGRMAKNSEIAEEKVFKQPSNEVWGLLDYAVDVETDDVLEPTVRDYVTDYGVIPIMKGVRATDGNFGVWVDDCLLGKTTDNFVSVGEQRGVAYLRKVFEAYLQRHRTQNNTPNMRRTVKEAFEAELVVWMGRKAFASENPSEAFYVNTDPEGESLNNPAVQDEMRFRALIGMATTRPGRFMELVFTRDNRAVESWIQQQLTATSAS